MLNYLKLVLFVGILLMSNACIIAQHNFKVELVKNINLFGDSDPGSFKSINNKVFFAADDGVHGRELWTTDGTPQGTYMVKDINPNGDGVTFKLTKLNNQIIFTADDGTHGIELWISDGSSQGTKMLKEINLNPNPYIITKSHSLISIWNKFKDELYFSGNDGVHGVEVWKTDGTDSGTVMLKDINPEGFNLDQIVSPVIAGGTEFSNKFYFMASDSIHGLEPWVTDGTTNGTKMLKDINPNGEGGGTYFYQFNNMLFFNAADSNGNELWVTDGTNSGTKMYTEINSNIVGYNSGSPHDFVSLNGKLYFSATPQNQSFAKLFFIDGIDSVAHQVITDYSVFWNFNNHYYYHNKMFFEGWSSKFSGEPCYTANEFVTSTMLKDIETTKLNQWDTVNLGSSPSHYFEFQDFLFFKARDRQDGGRQLFVYDDYKDTLQPLMPYSSHQIYNSANNFGSDFGVIVSGSSCYFVGEYDSSGVELWRMYDSTAVGIEENKTALQSNIKVYPNPNSQEFVNLEIPTEWSGLLQIEMVDITGKTVCRKTETANANATIPVPIKNLSPGIYFIKVRSKNQSETVRFVRLE